jgi:hypothetical protein
MRVSSALVLLGSLVALIACGNETPMSPHSVVSTPSAAAEPVTPGLFIYEYFGGLPEPVSPALKFSYYSLHEGDGTFQLIYGNDIVFDGTYTHTDDGFAFSFTAHDWSPTLPPPGPWKATGTLSGNELTVRYSAEMKSRDFADAVYKQSYPR